MSKYMLRLVAISNGNFDLDKDEIRKIELKISDGVQAEVNYGERGDQKAIRIQIEDIESRERALVLGELLKKAITLCGVRLRCGVFLGNDKSSLKFSDQLVDGVFEKTGYTLIPEAIGINIVEQSKRPGFINFNATGTISGRGHDIVSCLFEVVKFADAMDKRVFNAAKLYTTSRFLKNQVTRLLLLVSVVEIVSRQRNASERQKSFVTDVIWPLVNGYFENENESESVRKLLNGMLNYGESKLESCRRMLNGYCSESQVNVFVSMYNARSRFLHDGIVPKDDCMSLIDDLDCLVSDLLLRIVGCVVSHGRIIA